MAIEWPLVVFTALTGCGGWVAVCIAVSLLSGKEGVERANFAAAATAIVLLGVGGCASVLHLQHPDKILNALSHPTSGIFVEAVLVGLCALAVFVFAVMLKRQTALSAQKVVAALGGMLGVALAFMAGHSYMMASIPAWNTYLLPLGYLLTAAPAGVAVYLAVGLSASRGLQEKAASQALENAAEEPVEERRPFNAPLFQKILFAAGIASALGALAYGVSTGQDGIVAIMWVCTLVVGGMVPAACAYVAWRKPVQEKALAVLALACALAASVLFRCMMWISGLATLNFFGGM